MVNSTDAAYRFYKSKGEEESRKRRGLAESQKQSKRRHERIVRVSSGMSQSVNNFDDTDLLCLQKRKERAAAVTKNSRLTEEQKKKWLSVITNDFMSSEESGSEDNNVVHPLVWRSKYVSTMFEKIDAYIEHKKSPQARRQMKKRITGCDSVRLEPLQGPEWAITKK